MSIQIENAKVTYGKQGHFGILKMNERGPAIFEYLELLNIR